MNSLILDGLCELKAPFTDFFKNKVKARRVWRLKERNPNVLKNFVWEEYIDIMKREGVEKAYRWSSFLFSGWKDKKIRSYSKKIWRQELKKKTDSNAVHPYKEMIGLVRFLIEKGWNVFIITASPESIIQEVSSVYSVPKENVIGMRLIESGGYSTPEILEPYTYGNGKVKALYDRIGDYADLAFGDSENDYPLLKSAKRFGVLLDKGNSELVDKCKSINCLIQPVFK
jgi:phosphoserine phosphatase